MNSAIDRAKLVSTLAFALRHNPAQLGLVLDEEGWASLTDMLAAIRFDRYDWALIDETFLKATIEGMERFEISDGRIRARYGHSIQLGKLPPVAVPPPVLFHGTTEQALPTIRREGLKPIGRRFVHLTSNREYALLVANAKHSHTVVVVQAATASVAGHVFRCANARVWLTEHVEPIFLITESEPVLA